MPPCSRRRFATTLLGGSLGATLLPRCQRNKADDTLQSATGVAFGTKIQVTIAAPAATEPDEWFGPVFAEIQRLESLFTLFDPASPIRRLNDDGVLRNPPPELIAILAACDRVHELTGGAFDPTVQPLWELYESHFARHPADTAGPPAEALSRTRELVGWKQLTFDQGEVRFEKAGMKLTLNGIAPGYTADAVASHLSERGIAHALIDCGEFRSLGSKPDGTPWQVGIRGPGDPDDGTPILDTAELNDDGLATSAGYATAFDLAARFHHLFSPRRDRFSPSRKVVSVQAPEAALADALATAGGVMDAGKLDELVAPLDDITARFYDAG